MALPAPHQTPDHWLMDVLVLETEPGSADWTIDELIDRGHRVSRCHERGRPAFPCRALERQGSCPLSNPGIDVAVTVRAHPGTRPALREDGVACALRARVPLVVAGRVAFNPYEEWADEVVEDGDVVGACERVVAAPSRAHSQVAQTALRDALRRRAGSAGGADALVWRNRGGLRVRLEGLDLLDRSISGLVAADVAAALRAFDLQAPRIDISLGDASKRRP
jgi:hypothetical protein